MAICGPPLVFPVRSIFGELFEFDSTIEKTAYFNAVVDLRIKLIRYTAQWDRIQPTSPLTFSWAKNDDVMRRGHDSGADFIVTVGPNVPDWANSSQGFGFPPDTKELLATWTTNLVNRYKPGGDFSQEFGFSDGWGVRLWEIWNEQNLTGFWHNPNPFIYTSYLQAAYTAAKAADPNCTVIMGGLSLSGTAPGLFTNACYNAGMKGYIDYLCVHPFGVGTDPLSPTFTDPIEKMLLAADLAGDTGRRMFITEMIVGGGPQRPKHIRDLYNIQLFNPDLRLSCVCMTALRDTGSEFQGLVTASGTPKALVYDTYKDDLQDGVGPANV